MSSGLKSKIKNIRFFVSLYRFMYRLTATVYWSFEFCFNKLFKKEHIYANCFVFTTPFGKTKKNNWGDDINDFFFNSIISRKIRFVPFDKLLSSPKVTRYSLIGSIIGNFDLNNTIVYGSGSITSSPEITGTPVKVLSVRGPLTREILIKQGIDCPEVYGDPALLLSRFYVPQIEKTDTIGIIPHYRTLESNWMDNKWYPEFCSKNNVKIIDMSKYDKWTDIIDSICSCKYIISESLHGLIVAESYSIPSIWVEIQKHDMPWEWDFKYRDFYSSINKSNEQCLNLYEADNASEIDELLDNWHPGDIDYASMLAAFPFEIKK